MKTDDICSFQPPLRVFSTDSSSLILLQRVSLSIVGYRLLVTAQVLKEILTGASQEEAATITSSVELFYLPADKIKEGGLSPTDAGVIRLYYAAGAEAVLSDDGRILRRCLKQGIPHYCCLSLLSLMVGDHLLPFRDAEEYFRRLIQVGRYSAAVIQKAEELLRRANMCSE